MQREQWQHPRSGEQVEAQLHPGVARLIRAGQVSEHHHPEDWEAQARQQAAEMQSHFRRQLEMLESGQVKWETQVPTDVVGGFIDNMRQSAETEAVFSPPPDSQLLQDLTRRQKAEGFLRRTTFDAGQLWLPNELEPHRSALEGSLRPVVRLAADAGRQPAPWESKVGGVPYRPLGTPWPRATQPDGRPLVFLAQLNFAELNPGGSALPDFPDGGLLQFFVLNDMWYGAEAEPLMNLNGAQSHYRVLYWLEMVQDPAALDLQVPPPQVDPQEAAELAALGWDPAGIGNHLIDMQLPHDPTREIALIGLADHEPVSGADDRSSRLLGINIWDSTPESDGAFNLSSLLYDLAAGGHKLGGYPNFTQSDPRGETSDLILLFQLDSDDALGLMWGDVGTANFFIRPGELAARDFSRVAMHWDCG